MSRLSWNGALLRAARVLAGAWGLAGTCAGPSVAVELVGDGLRVEAVVTGIPRPVELALDGAGNLVVLSHGRLGDSAAEIYRFDVAALPLEASRSPRVVVPFSEGSRKVAFGSLAVDPRSGNLFLGEENGNRIYRLTADGKLSPFAVGLHHLVGGSGLAFDGQGRLVVLDFASPETQLRSEAPPPPGFDWFTSEDYQGPLVFRLDPAADMPLPRRLDLVAPLFPRGSPMRGREEPPPRFISVAAAQPSGDLLLLSSLGEIFRLTPEGALRLLARLPAGHYHRTHLTVAPDGSVYVSSGFHMRKLYRISRDGAVTIVARELGDPGGVVVDRSGDVYVAETALHRIIRIRPSP